MRIIVSFNGGGLTITFENIYNIYNYDDYIVLTSDTEITVDVNAYDICRGPSLTIQKRWLLTADEVYLDTRIEEVNV